MNILDKIVAYKKLEVAERKATMPFRKLEQSPYFGRKTFSLSQALRNSEIGVIAEFKRQSPSKGIINANAVVEEVTQGYAKAGGVALSILTDAPSFGGSSEFLTRARAVNEIPILRKDFIIDEYQIVEAKAIGADVILLIAECLTKSQLRELAKFAQSLGLEVLMEIHSEDQLLKLNDAVNVVGVNNRNLKTFEVSIQTSIDLFSTIPNEFVKISESGISRAEPIVRLLEVGFDGFLIGEAFMKMEDPAVACEALIKSVMQTSFPT